MLPFVSTRKLFQCSILPLKLFKYLDVFRVLLDHRVEMNAATSSLRPPGSSLRSRKKRAESSCYICSLKPGSISKQGTVALCTVLPRPVGAAATLALLNFGVCRDQCSDTRGTDSDTICSLRSRTARLQGGGRYYAPRWGADEAIVSTCGKTIAARIGDRAGSRLRCARKFSTLIHAKPIGWSARAPADRTCGIAVV